MTDVVLERIWHPPSENSDPALPKMLVISITKGFFDHFVEIVIVGKEDMTTYVPGKVFIIDERGREASDMGIPLEDMPVALNGFIQMICSPNARWTGAKNNSSHIMKYCSLRNCPQYLKQFLS